MVSAKANEAKDKAEAFKAQRAQRHDRCFTLLVIDDQNTDWSKVRSSFKAIQMRNSFDVLAFHRIDLITRSISVERKSTPTGIFGWSRLSSRN